MALFQKKNKLGNGKTEKPKIGCASAIVKTGVAGILSLTLGTTGTLLYFNNKLENKIIPEYREKYLKNMNLPYNARIITSDNQAIGGFNPNFTTENREFVKEVPKPLEDVVIAFEDKKFKKDSVNFLRLAKAVFETYAHGNTQGGSTLTMQLAKMIKGDRTQNAKRKIEDILLSFAIDEKFSKEEIMNLYFTYAYFGNGQYGIYSACRYYLEKPECKGISLDEAAMLVSFLKNPTRYSLDADIAREHRNIALARIAESKVIQKAYGGKEKILNYMNAPIKFSQAKIVNKHPFISEAVRQELFSKLGERIYTDGILVHTTIDSKVQEAAEAAMKIGFEHNDKLIKVYYKEITDENGNKKRVPIKYEGTLIAIDPQTGYVKGFVGARDWKTSEFFFSNGKRQLGSGVKPPIYAEALERKVLTPDSIISDSAVCYNEKCFVNYHGQSVGAISVRDALQKSVNRPAVRIMLDAGIANVIQKYYLLGAEGPLIPNPQFALGAGDISPMELVTAIASLQNGYHFPTTFIEYVEDKNGKILIDNRKPKGKRMWSKQTITDMMNMMQRVPLDGGTVPGLSRVLEEQHFKDTKIKPKYNTRYDAKKHQYKGAPNLGCKTGTETQSRMVGLTCIISDTDEGFPLAVTTYFGYGDAARELGASLTGGRASQPAHVEFIKRVTMQAKTPKKEFKSFDDRFQENFSPTIYETSYTPDKVGYNKNNINIVTNKGYLTDIINNHKGKNIDELAQLFRTLGIEDTGETKNGEKDKSFKKELLNLIKDIMKGEGYLKFLRAEQTTEGFDIHYKRCREKNDEKSCFGELIKHYSWSAEQNPFGMKNLSYLKDGKDIAAFRLLDQNNNEPKEQVYIKTWKKFIQAKIVEDTIKRGPFITSWNRQGMNDAQLSEIRTMMPEVDFDRINMDFHYKIIMLGNQIVSAQVDVTNSNLEVSKKPIKNKNGIITSGTVKAVTIDDRCITENGQDCYQKDWPTRKGKFIFYKTGNEKVTERSVTQIRSEEGTDVLASYNGTVAYSNKEWGTLVINYETKNGSYAAQYEGIYSKLNNGEKIKQGQMIGEIDNRANLFLRVKKGQASGINNHQDSDLDFKMLVDILEFLPVSKKIDTPGINKEIEYRLKLLDFFSKQYDVTKKSNKNKDNNYNDSNNQRYSNIFPTNNNSNNNSIITNFELFDLSALLEQAYKPEPNYRENLRKFLMPGKRYR
ncbi:MAG: transglycosylase domain-containing protein [Nanoarchaeota archaeon]|nr:transglycosylase domain-containing protein [Nanoarchaeota archaeon]